MSCHTDSFLNVAGLETPRAERGGDVSWLAAGFTLFAFAAPSAIQSAPFFVGATGFLGSILICTLTTFGSVAGGWMLLQVKLKFEHARNFGELGFEVFGRWGRMYGNLIQLGNFVLFLPCGLLFTGQALSGIGHGIAAFTQDDGAPCADYYIFAVAFFCFLTTQARTLSQTTLFSALSVFSVLMMASLQISTALTNDVSVKAPAQWFGNPGDDSFVYFTRGASICIFGYVPSFLTAELASCMRNPLAMSKSLAFSGLLNVVAMLGVGTLVVARWGFNQGYVASLTGQLPGTAKVNAWTAGQLNTTLLQVFALVGNFVSYMLDSVPLGRFCQKTWAPTFQDTWSASDIVRYMGYTFPQFALGLLLAVFFPSLNLLIDVVTCMTTPWVTMVYPVALYWKTYGSDMKTRHKLIAASVFAIGISCFLISAVACVGQLWLRGTRDWQIGCQGWMLLAPWSP